MASIVSSVITALQTVISKKYELFGGLNEELKRIQNEFQQMMDFQNKYVKRSLGHVEDYPLHLRSLVAVWLEEVGGRKSGSHSIKDTQINSYRLAQLWIAEGFIETIEGMTLEEVAESYLMELVDRCLVQVASTDDANGGIEDIRVHDIIRHVIILKASEHNMTTIFHGQEEMSFQNNVRRLSIQGSIDGDSKQAQDYCKFLRTLYLNKIVGGHISESSLSLLLSNGRMLLKVLHLYGAQLEKFPDEIFKLFHLKYLDVGNTNVRCVPKSIGMLQSLQFLNLYGTHVTILPAEIQKLQHLRHLLIGRSNLSALVAGVEDAQGARASFRIGKLKSLRQLLFIEADQVDNIRVVTEIGKLIHLRTLGITKLKREDGKELCSSLGNLRDLRKLWVSSVNEEEVIDFQHFKPSDLPRLQALILAGRLEKSPDLISSLNGLTRMDLQYSRLRDDPLKCLHDLPNLIDLVLTAAYQGEGLRFKAGGFPKLKKLYLILLEELRWMTVEENALPSLRELVMRDCQSMKEIPTGIEYLMNGQNLQFTNMSNEFVDKLVNLDKKSAAYKRFLQIPEVDIATWTDGRWLEYRRLNKETGTFNNGRWYIVMGG